MNANMGDSILKYLDPEEFYMAVEAEWDESTKIMIN